MLQPIEQVSHSRRQLGAGAQRCFQQRQRLLAAAVGAVAAAVAQHDGGVQLARRHGCAQARGELRQLHPRRLQRRPHARDDEARRERVQRRRQQGQRVQQQPREPRLAAAVAVRGRPVPGLPSRGGDATRAPRVQPCRCQGGAHGRKLQRRARRRRRARERQQRGARQAPHVGLLRSREQPPQQLVGRAAVGAHDCRRFA